MSGGIYLIQEDDRLVEMMEQAYETEDQLQDLLEKHPKLLAGDHIDRDTPRRWLLISRENPVLSEEDEEGLWSLEHLFLDQDAIPTFVEVKRADNAPTRRQLVGQLLDYAANATVYWSIETIVAQFEANCREQGSDPEQVFEAFLTSEDEEQFWQKVKTNLQAGKVRLVFVADEISAELRRIVEFLNERMDPLEVLALEIKQYVSQNGLRTLVPRLIGQTAEAKQKKISATRERRKWDEESFFPELEARHSQEDARIAEKIYDWARHQMSDLEVEWMLGNINGGFVVMLPQPGRKPHELFTIRISGILDISARRYATQAPYHEPQAWQRLRERMSSIGLALPSNPDESRLPYFALSSLTDEQTLEQVLLTFADVAREIHQASELVGVGEGDR